MQQGTHDAAPDVGKLLSERKTLLGHAQDAAERRDNGLAAGIKRRISEIDGALGEAGYYAGEDEVEPDEERDEFDVLEDEADGLIKKIKAIPDNVDVVGKRRLMENLQQVREKQERLLNERKTPKEPTDAQALFNARGSAVVPKGGGVRQEFGAGEITRLPPEQRDAAVTRLMEVSKPVFRERISQLVDDGKSTYEKDRQAFELLLRAAIEMKTKGPHGHFNRDVASDYQSQLREAERKLIRKWPQWEKEKFSKDKLNVGTPTWKELGK